MHFSLFSTPTEHPSTDCFFQVHTQDLVFHSPFFGHPQMAIEAMEHLILRLRRATPSQLASPGANAATVAIDFFGKSSPVRENILTLEKDNSTAEFLARCQAEAQANTFRLIFLELEEQNDVESLKDLDYNAPLDNYTWRQAGTSLIQIGQSERSGAGFKPSVGAQANLTRSPCEPIFNALQPFVSADFPLFKGRKREVEEVHTLMRRRSLLLLYGAPRVGKTSLLQCGLANRIAKDQEELFVVSCGEESILEKVTTALKLQLAKYTNDDFSEVNNPQILAKQLGGIATTRQFLVIDHLEDLFSTTVFDAERIALFDLIRNLTETEHNQLRVIMVLREGFLAPLAEHEEYLPSLLENRFRLLPLKESSLVDATVNLLDIFKTQEKVAVDDSRAVSEKICRELADENGNVPAHCLQIYLHQLHQTSCQNTAEGPVPITTDLVDQAGPPTDLINNFYAEELGLLTPQRAFADGTPNPAVEKKIADLEKSRQDCGCTKETNTVVAAGVAPVSTRGSWWWLLALPFIPLGMALAWWLYPTPETLTPCEIVEQDPGNCSAYVNYLCTYGDSTDCVPSWVTTTDLDDCEIWRDYKTLKKRESCITYQAFFYKYREQGVCMDFVQPRLLDWECPLVVDTVQLTIRDTLIQRVPSRQPAGVPTMAGTTPRIETPACQTFGTVTLKSVGPLLIMTDNLTGGPYRWEDALTACSEKGLRLPCIGEIDFLIEKIYSNDRNRAYEMLTGTGDCSLINPAEIVEGRIDFWSATEANDATAWSYYFDTGLKTIGRQPGMPKSARLPCLCVKKDPQQRGSSLPACYGKQLDRSLE